MIRSNSQLSLSNGLHTVFPLLPSCYNFFKVSFQNLFFSTHIKHSLLQSSLPMEIQALRLWYIWNNNPLSIDCRRLARVQLRYRGPIYIYQIEIRPSHAFHPQNTALLQQFPITTERISYFFLVLFCKKKKFYAKCESVKPFMTLALVLAADLYTRSNIITKWDRINSTYYCCLSNKL